MLFSILNTKPNMLENQPFEGDFLPIYIMIFEINLSKKEI